MTHALLKTFLCVATTMVALFTLASATADVTESVNAALADPVRTDAERLRDDNRKPAETLKFFQLREDMRVLELVPGGGWYSKILAPVLRDNGKLYLAIGTDRIEESLLKEKGFDKVAVIPVQGNIQRDGRRLAFDALSLDVDNIDLVLTFRNLHNFNEQGRAQMNQAAFDALKSGGLYGVVDHTRRHMEAESPENWRRMDPVLMIKEIAAIGFEFVDFSDLHTRPDDELRFEVGRKTVAGNTDRFTLLFRKP